MVWKCPVRSTGRAGYPLTGSCSSSRGWIWMPCMKTWRGRLLVDDLRIVEILPRAVERDRQRRELEREIAVLEKKVLRERQFNKQIEMNGELRRLMRELEVSTNG